MFEDRGFKVYKKREITYSQKKLAEKIETLAKQWLEISTLRSLQIATNTLF